jgi:hypothetical protein
VLTENPPRIDVKFLKRFPEFVAFRVSLPKISSRRGSRCRPPFVAVMQAADVREAMIAPAAGP